MTVDNNKQVVPYQTIIHQTDSYNVVLNPASDRSIWIGLDGKEYLDNYLVIHTQFNTVEYRAQDILNALSVAEHMQHALSNKEYLYNDPFAQVKAAMKNGSVVPFGEAASQDEQVEDGEIVDEGKLN